DGFDPLHRKTKLISDLGQRDARAALVLNLVMALNDLRPRAIERDVALYLRRDLLIGPDLFRLDLADMHKHGPEASAHRLSDRARLKRKCGIGYRRIDNGGLLHNAQTDVGILQLPLACELREGESLGQTTGGGARFLGIGKYNLLHLAALRRHIAGPPLLISLARL